jgi:hypothetical protein
MVAVQPGSATGFPDRRWVEFLRKYRRPLIAAAAAVVVLVWLFVWPGVYEYQEIKETLNGVPTAGFARINRLTGSTQVLIGGRWLLITRAVQLPPRERSQLVGYAALGTDGYFGGNLHNGSQWTVTRVIVRVDGQAQQARPGATVGPWTRTLSIDLRLLPDSTALIRVPATDQRELTERQLVARGWSIIRAYGYPP